MQKDESEIDYCPQCRGVWLDRGEIDKIAHVQDKYEDALYQKYDDIGYYNRDKRNRDFLMIYLILIN